MWEKTYMGVLCCMMERVRDCGCIERLSAMLEMDELRTFQWLDHLYDVSREYFSMKILMTQAIFPNRAGNASRRRMQSWDIWTTNWYRSGMASG